MRVFVTGASGGVGKIAARRLHEEGAKVIGFSRKGAEVHGVDEYIAGDVADYDQLRRAMAGCDAVLHLAAYHMPYDAPEHEMFRVNVGGTFNVFKACVELGIKRVAVASSTNAVGYNFGIDIQDLSYLPVDGAHPVYTTDPYSYTKQKAEDVGGYFYRRHGVSSVFMRLGLDFRTVIEEWAAHPDRYKQRSLRKLVDGLLALPEAEAAIEVGRIESEMGACRRRAYAGAPYKNGTEYVYEHFSEELKIWGYLVHNFLMYLDGRDLGDALARSLSAGYEGCNIVFVADYANMLGVESIKLAKLLYPGAIPDAGRLSGFNALVDYREAERVIGFKAKYSLSDYYGMLYGAPGTPPPVR